MVRLRVVRSRSIRVMVGSRVDGVDGSVVGSRVDWGVVGSGMNKGSGMGNVVGSGMKGSGMKGSMVGKMVDGGVVCKGSVVGGGVVDTISHSHANKGQDAECLSWKYVINLFKFCG